MATLQESNNNLINSSEQLLTDLNTTIRLYNDLIQNMSNEEKKKEFNEEFNSIVHDTCTLSDNLAFITENLINLSNKFNEFNQNTENK